CEIDLLMMIKRYGSIEGSSLLPEQIVKEGVQSNISVRCLGGFSVSVGGEPIDLLRVKPRARTALRLLGMYGGRPVHRETLIEALWPFGSEEAGTRSLHVAISSLRQLLEPGVPRGTSSFLVREGDAYRLAIPEAGESDVLAFEEALVRGRASRAIQDYEDAITSFEKALELYSGDLLPEDGPVEWVITPRERYRSEATEAAQLLAEMNLELDRPETAIVASERGLRIDRFRDELWRLAFNAYERAGDQASAARARREYASVLRELGVAPVLGA
ncbi:MAG: AfsR/SARP family transcriptional regulator, partial [Acidimicrobiia bacterium]